MQEKRSPIHNFCLRNVFSLDTFFAFLLLCNALPYFVWGQHIHNYLLYPVLLFYAIKYKKEIKEIYWGLLAIFIFIVLYCAFQEDSIGTVLNYLSLPCLLLIAKFKSKSIYDRLVNIFAFFVALSILFYFVYLLLPDVLPKYEIPPINPAKDFNYFVYPFFVVPNTFAEYRFYGLFDEAGANGTITALFLYIEGYSLKKKRNIILLINGIISLSFFFILSSLLYFIVSKGKKIRDNLHVFLLGIFFVALFYNYTKDDVVIKFFVWDRITLNDEGTLSGDNRSDKYFEYNYNNFLMSSDVFWGRGVGSGIKAAEDSSSYKLLVYDYGIIWFLTFIIFWVVLIYKENRVINVNLLIMLLLFFIMIYQRPAILAPFYSFLFMNLYPYKTNYAIKSKIKSNRNE